MKKLQFWLNPRLMPSMQTLNLAGKVLNTTNNLVFNNYKANISHIVSE